MSEGVNVEDPVPEPVAADPEPIAAPADPDEADAVELPAGKHVPLSALRSVREENKTLKAQAAEAAQLKQQVANLQGQVSSFQQISQTLSHAPAQAAPTGADPELVEIARSLDYLNTDGSPNLERAAAHQKIIQKQARAMAEQMVGPLALNQYQDREQRNWTAATQEKLPNGEAIDPQLLTTAWVEVKRANPAMVADPKITRAIVNQVMAEQMRQMPASRFTQTQPPGAPPLRTEPVGNAPARTAKPITELERDVLKNRSGKSIDDKAYAELTKGFVAGRTNVLEDD